LYTLVLGTQHHTEMTTYLNNQINFINPLEQNLHLVKTFWSKPFGQNLWSKPLVKTFGQNLLVKTVSVVLIDRGSYRTQDNTDLIRALIKGI
jgi:hypothetical protein